MKNKNFYLGVFFILMSAFGFATMQLFVNLIPYDPFTKIFFRNLITFLVSISILKFQKKKFHVPKNARLLLLTRSIMGYLGMLFTFLAAVNMKLADATIISKLSPFLVILICYFAYGEKITKYQLIAIIIAFIGMLFVVKPEGNFITKGSIYALCNAIFAAISYSAIRGLNIKKVDGNVIIIVFSLLCMIFSLPFMFYYKPTLMLDTLLYLLLLGIFGVIGQYGITFAYVFAPAKDVSVFEYTQVLFSAILGYLFLNQLPDIYSFIGYIIIIFASCLSIFINSKNKKK